MPRRRLSKDKQQKIALAGIVAAIALAGMYLFWISPAWDLATTSRAQIQNLERDIAEMQRRAKIEAVNQPMLEQVVAFAKPLRDGAVTGDPYMWVVLQMNALAEAQRARIPTPRAGARIPHPRVGGYELLNTSLELDTGYDEIGEFVREFENRFPLGEIRMLEITPSEPTGARRRAKLEAYFLVWPEDRLKTKP
jgi:hypothetical protein